MARSNHRRNVIEGQLLCCNRCHEDKPAEAFSYRSKDQRYDYTCKECNCVVARKRRLENLAATRAYERKIVLKRKGLTPEQYEAFWEAQGGVCAICGQPETVVHYKHKGDGLAKVKELAVDHDHKTSEVRGLLCGNCNSGLGYFRDDPELLMKAVEYLRNHGAGAFSPVNGA